MWSLLNMYQHPKTTKEQILCSLVLVIIYIIIYNYESSGNNFNAL